MKKEIYINESMGETRIAIMEDGQLVEVYIEKQDKHYLNFLKKELKVHNIHISNYKETTHSERIWLAKYFQKNILSLMAV